MTAKRAQMTKETSLDQGRPQASAKWVRDYVAIKKGEHGALLFGEGRIFQLRRLSAGRHPRSDRGGGHVCRRDGRLSRGHGEEVQFTDLRER